MQVKVGTAAVIPVLLTDATDRLTEETGIVSPTVYATKNGGASAAVTPSAWVEPDATHNPGLYWMTLPASLNDTLGAVAGTVTRSATNYLLNTSFEIDSNGDGLADNWTNSGTATATASRVTTTPAHGTYAQRLQYTGQAGDSGKTVTFDQSSAVGTFAAGQTAVGSFTLRGSVTGVTVQGILYARSAAMSNLGQQIVSITPTGTNTRYTVTYPNLPANTSLCQLRLYIFGIDAGDSIDVTVDAWQIQKDRLTDYIYTGATTATVNECAPYSFSYQVVSELSPDNTNIVAAKVAAEAAKASADLANRVAPDNAGIAAAQAAAEAAPTLAAITAAVVPGIAAVTTTSPAGDQLHIVRGTDFSPEFDFGRTLTAAACVWTLTPMGATTPTVTKSATVTGESWQPSLTDAETTALGDLYDYRVSVTEGSSTTVTHEGLVIVTS